MRAWEFLIQKEGDRAWLPLEPPRVQVLEGRYRLVIRSQFPQTPIQINLTYQNHPASKPQVQTRHHQTNKEGLMVVFPYTYLKAGLWEIVCILPPRDQSPPSYGVSLESLSLDPEPDPPELEEEENQSRSSDSQESYDSSFFDIPPPPVRPHATSSETKPPAHLLGHRFSYGTYNAIADLSSINLRLDQPMYLADDEGKITLTGELRGDRPQLFAQPLGLQLVVTLYNPQNLESIHSVKHLLVIQRLPVGLEYSFHLPSPSALFFMLGQAQLFPSGSTHPLPPQPHGQEPTPLSDIQFSITTGIRELMAAILLPSRFPNANISEVPEPSQNQTPPILPFPLTGKPEQISPPVPKPPAVNLDLFNIAKQQSTPVTLGFTPSSSPSLPPQLFSSPESGKTKSLQLPFLNGSSPPQTPLGEMQKPSPRKPSLTLPPLNLNPSSTVLEMGEPEPPEQSESLRDRFSSRPWQEKFVERLNELAREAEHWVEENPQSDSTPEEVLDAEFVEEMPLMLTSGSEVPLLLPAAQENSEEVVFPTTSDRNDNDPRYQSSQAFPTASDLKALPDDRFEGFPLSVPIPKIDSPERDWIAEEVIMIRISLATRSPHIHVKYWLVDAQTRTLLEPPRWIVDLSWDGVEGRCALLPLTVPHGVMEIQFEAIAVAVATQQESHKISLRRLILPPNLPELTFEELDN